MVVGDIERRAAERISGLIVELIEHRRRIPQRSADGKVATPIVRDYTAEEQQQVKSSGFWEWVKAAF